MRKEKLITRTVTITTVKVMAINILENSVVYLDVVLNDKVPHDKKLLDKCRAIVDEKKYAIAKIETVTYDDAIYECTLEQFLSVAHISETRK